MADNKHHKDSATEQEQKLFSELELTYKKSKADVWASMEGMMDQPNVPVKEMLAPKVKTKPAMAKVNNMTLGRKNFSR